MKKKVIARCTRHTVARLEHVSPERVCPEIFDPEMFCPEFLVPVLHVRNVSFALEHF